MRRTGFVCDDRFFDAHSHEDLGPWVAPGPEFETTAGKRRIRDLLSRTSLWPHLVALPPQPMAREDLLRFHTADYLDSLPGTSPWFGPTSFEIACLAAGGTAEAVRAVLDDEVDNAYALVRPPGHHALADEAMGYCLLANIVLAVLKARAERGLGRVVVLDWDVHHGNGTETAFYDDPDTLTISLHQDRLFPWHSGLVEHTGTGPGAGANINVPLPAGCGRGAYVEAFARVVEPAVRRFEPELIVVANGFDAGAFDPLGRMMLSAGAFGELARRTRRLAEELCEGRLVLSHEGGYAELHTPFCGLRVVEELSGLTAQIDDPFGHVDNYAAQQLARHQREAVDRVVEVHGLGAR